MSKQSIRRVPTLIAVGLVMMASTAAGVQSEGGRSQLEERIRKSLVTLPYYSVFDSLAFRLEGTRVVLMGQVTRPTLKSGAEAAVKRQSDVGSVENQIEVLPVSPNDDRIRMDVYRAIYYYPDFTRYAVQAVPPIHIIVKNGDVALEGMVATEGDKSTAGIRARGVAGVFSVKNNLQVER